MTVLQLLIRLATGIISGRFRPGDVIVREFGFENPHVYVEIQYVELLLTNKHRKQFEGSDAERSMFGGPGTRGKSRIVRLD